MNILNPMYFKLKKVESSRLSYILKRTSYYLEI